MYMEPQTSPTATDSKTRTCAFCSIPFTPRRHDQACCSAKCRGDYERLKASRAKQRQPHSLCCAWCDNTFYTARTDRDFCSTACQQAFNNFWKGWGPRFGKALTTWRVRKRKGAFTNLCRLFSAAREDAKDKRKDKQL
jgi:hypothetical protein